MIYIIGIIPLFFSIFAITTNKYIFKALVTSVVVLFCTLYLFIYQLPTSFLWIIGALLFSIIGDYFLSNKNKHKSFYIYGIAIFFLAHMCYLIYMLLNGSINLLVLSFLLVSFSAYFFMRLKKTIHDKFILSAVVSYLLISCFTFASAFNLEIPFIAKLLLIISIGLIVLSDTMISETDFINNKRTEKFILPTYYLAHILILYSVFFI